NIRTGGPGRKGKVPQRRGVKQRISIFDKWINFDERLFRGLCYGKAFPCFFGAFSLVSRKVANILSHRSFRKEGEWRRLTGIGTLASSRRRYSALPGSRFCNLLVILLSSISIRPCVLFHAIPLSRVGLKIFAGRTKEDAPEIIAIIRGVTNITSFSHNVKFFVGSDKGWKRFFNQSSQRCYKRGSLSQHRKVRLSVYHEKKEKATNYYFLVWTHLLQKYRSRPGSLSSFCFLLFSFWPFVYKRFIIQVITIQNILLYRVLLARREASRSQVPRPSLNLVLPAKEI